MNHDKLRQAALDLVAVNDALMVITASLAFALSDASTAAGKAHKAARKGASGTRRRKPRKPT